jgi:GntR family transcriptional regulator
VSSAPRRSRKQPLEGASDILRRGIEDGSYPPDRALPSIRTLQQTYGIADGTIQKALAILKAEGLVRGVRGRGVFVTSRT